jgi:hypothetical protein
MVRRDTGTISDTIIRTYSFIYLFIEAQFSHCEHHSIILIIFYYYLKYKNCVSFFFCDLNDTGEKIDINVADAGTIVPALLATIQSDMFIKAKAGRDEKMATVLKWEDFVPALEKDCLVLTPFCDEAEWEEKVKVCYVSL